MGIAHIPIKQEFFMNGNPKGRPDKRVVAFRQQLKREKIKFTEKSLGSTYPDYSGTEVIEFKW